MCDYENSSFFHCCRSIRLIYLISAVVIYKDYHSQSNILTSLTAACFSYFERSKQQLMRCFFQDLGLNVHSYLDLCRHWYSLSFEKHWCYLHAALPRATGSKIYIWCMKDAWMWMVQSDLLKWTGRKGLWKGSKFLWNFL